MLSGELDLEAESRRPGKGGTLAARRPILFTVVVAPNCESCDAARELVEDVARANTQLGVDLHVVDVVDDPKAVIKLRAMTHPTFLVQVDGKERFRMCGSVSKRKLLYRLLPVLYGDDQVALAQLRRQLGPSTETFPSGPFRGRVRQAEKIELIRQVPLFNGLARRQLAQLARLADEVHREKNEIVINEGEVGDEFFVVVNGRVQVMRDNIQPISLGAGECFGEMSLLDGQSRSATVTSTAPSTLLVVHRGDFERWLTSTPPVMRALLTTLSQRLRYPT